MKRLIAAILLPLLLVQATPALAFTNPQEAAKIIQQSKVSVTPALLVNGDIIRMVRADFTPDTIIAQIKSAPCNFVTTPAALRQLKEEGVPDSVILAMVMAAKSGAEPSAQPATERSVKVKIPNGVPIQAEAPYDVNSQLVRKGDKISFRVTAPVKVDGVVVIAQGATATAEVVLAERGGHFGRAGRLAWAMKDVVAVDGTRVPLQQGGRIVGDSHGGQVATQIAIMSATLFIVAPLALLAGFRRGENAVLPAGKRIEVLSQGETTVTASVPAN